MDNETIDMIDKWLDIGIFCLAFIVTTMYGLIILFGGTVVMGDWTDGAFFLAIAYVALVGLFKTIKKK